MMRRLCAVGLLWLLACGQDQGTSSAEQAAPGQGKGGASGKGGSGDAGTGGSDAGAGGSDAGAGGSDAGAGGSDAGTAGVGGSDAGAGGSTAGSGGSTAGSGGSGGSNAGSGGSAAGSGGSGQAGASPGLSTSVEVTGLAVFQAVKVALVENGQEVSPKNAPVVAGRSAVVRAYVKPIGGGGAQQVSAELLVESGGTTAAFQDTRTISGASSDASAASVFAFEVDGALVTPTMKLSVRVLDAQKPPVMPGESSLARFPRDGAALPVPAALPGGALKITLVPMRYDTDGSGRLPDTGPEQLERMRALLRALYPVAEVVLTVRDPVSWSYSKTLTGNVKFGAMNNLLVGLRAEDKAPDDVYYYALVAPASTYGAYCGGSCVTGQSFVVDDPGDADIRVGSGLGFTGEDSAWTLAHELGHMHGRSHAPCGVDSYDPDFPYSKGATGVWGYDERHQEFFDPGPTRDMMGYCEPSWISDYTYKAMFQRVQAVNGAGQQLAWETAPAEGPAPWMNAGHAAGQVAGHAAEKVELVRIQEDEDGVLDWGGVVRRATPRRPGAPARWLDEAGRPLAETLVFRVEQAHGGATWFTAPPPSGAARLSWADGRSLPL